MKKCVISKKGLYNIHVKRLSRIMEIVTAEEMRLKKWKNIE